MKSVSSVQHRMLGALYGQMLGDSMGMPAELWSRAKVQQYFGYIDTFLDGPADNDAACYFKAGQFTDDTAMALALADALLECGGEINPELIAQHMIQWVNSIDGFDKNILGPSSKQALHNIKAGKSISSLNNNGITNGAAMRASPLGCLLPTTSLATFVEEVWQASSPTHKSDVAVAGAVVIAWAVSRGIEQASWQSILQELPDVAEFAQNYHPSTFSPSLAKRIKLADWVIESSDNTVAASEQIYQLIGAGVSTVQSVPAAIAMVSLSDTDPNKCAILCANLGGDTDTIGAMATAICGALHGVEAINAEWLSYLKHINQRDMRHYSLSLMKYRQHRVESLVCKDG